MACVFNNYAKVLTDRCLAGSWNRESKISEMMEGLNKETGNFEMKREKTDVETITTK